MSGDMRDDEVAPEPSPEISAHLRDRSVWAEPPAELESDVLAALRRARGAAASSKTADPEHPGVPDELAQVRERRAGRRLSPRVLVAAASVAVLAVLAVAGLQLRESGPQATVVALDATPLAGDASGTAAVTSRPSGFEIRLDVRGLPPAPTGSYYQGWLNGPSGSVTIGTFHGRDGARDVVLWAGVNIEDFPILTVTMQTVDGGPQSSGRVVLRAEIR